MLTADGRSVDRLGRQVPHQVNAATLVRAIPGFGQHLELIPPQYTDVTEDGHMTVACPCGAKPVADYLQIASCDCGRTFVNGGGKQALVAKFE